MKSTLADVKQVFNIKAIASEGLTPGAIPVGQFGIINVATGLTVAASAVVNTGTYQFVNKIGSKVYASPSIKAGEIFNNVTECYQTELVNIWEGTLENCSCIQGVQLNINLETQDLMQNDGLNWRHRDHVVEVAPEEIACLCACDGKNPVYENNVMTNLLVKKVNAKNSPFYEASMKISIAGLTTYNDQAALAAAIVTTPALQFTGALALVTGEGLKQYNGTAWVVVGTIAGLITNGDAFVANGKTINTNASTTDDGKKLILIISGKLSGARVYNDLDVNYIYLRGVKLHPNIIVNAGEKNVGFTQTQALRYEIGAGYDARAVEWENMNYYTNLNNYPQLSDGIQSSEVVYQLENNTNYHSINFEFMSDKTERNNGDKLLRGIILYYRTDVTVDSAFASLFGSGACA